MPWLTLDSSILGPGHPATWYVGKHLAISTFRPAEIVLEGLSPPVLPLFAGLEIDPVEDVASAFNVLALILLQANLALDPHVKLPDPVTAEVCTCVWSRDGQDSVLRLCGSPLSAEPQRRGSA